MANTYVLSGLLLIAFILLAIFAKQKK